MIPNQKHRNQSGREYSGLTIHAARGVHEHAIEVVKSKWAAGDHILDLGAGSGAFSKRLQDNSFNVKAVDLDTTQIPAEIDSLAADAIAGLDDYVSSDSVDGVIALELLEHVQNPKRLLEEAFRVLKPGAGLLSSTPNVAHLYSRIKFALTGEFVLFTPELYWYTGHQNILPLWLIQQHLRSVGFGESEVGYAGDLALPKSNAVLGRIVSTLYRPKERTLGVKDDKGILFVYAEKPNLH